MIDKEIHFGAIIFDIPREYLRIGGFEHELFHPEFVNEAGWHVRAPWIDILSDAFALHHDHIRAGLEESLGLDDCPTWIPCAFRRQLRRSRRTARAELNANFGLRFQPGLVHQFDEPQPVIHWDGDETGRDFDDVEAELLAFDHISPHRLSALG